MDANPTRDQHPFLAAITRVGPLSAATCNVMKDIGMFSNRGFVAAAANKRKFSLATAIAIAGLAGWPVAGAQAETLPQFRYQKISLDAAMPADVLFIEPFKVTDSRRVYLTAFKCPDDNCRPFVAEWRNGKITILQEGVGRAANERGTVGGSVVTDFDNFFEQAALFHGGSVKLIPRLPNEITSYVALLSDSGIALVESFDATTFALSRYLYWRGMTKPVDFEPSDAGPREINARGDLAGTFSFPGPGNDRAARFQASSGTTSLREPQPPETESQGWGIDNSGGVLGYSFIAGSLERIGVWRGTRFKTFFVQGTSGFPIPQLLWNERGLIASTFTSEGNSYLVPKPGVRIKLADVTPGLPPFTRMLDINSRGDMIGNGGPSFGNVAEYFFLRRVSGREALQSSSGASSAVPSAAMSRAIARPRPAALERLLALVHRADARSRDGLTAP